MRHARVTAGAHPQHRDETLIRNFKTLCDAERGPSPEASALTSIRAAAEILRLNAMTLRGAPPGLVSAAAYSELESLSRFLSMELTMEGRRLDEDSDDMDDYDAHDSDDSESDGCSLASGDSGDSGDREVMRQAIA